MTSAEPSTRHRRFKSEMSQETVFAKWMNYSVVALSLKALCLEGRTIEARAAELGQDRPVRRGEAPRHNANRCNRDCDDDPEAKSGAKDYHHTERDGIGRGGRRYKSHKRLEAERLGKGKARLQRISHRDNENEPDCRRQDVIAMHPVDRDDDGVVGQSAEKADDAISPTSIEQAPFRARRH